MNQFGMNPPLSIQIRSTLFIHQIQHRGMQLDLELCTEHVVVKFDRPEIRIAAPFRKHVFKEFEGVQPDIIHSFLVRLKYWNQKGGQVRTDFLKGYLGRIR